MKIKMTVSQQLAAVRANPFAILTIDAPHVAAVIEAVNGNPQIADKLVRRLPYDYIAKNFDILERAVANAAKRAKLNVPLYMWTHSVHAAMVAGGANVEMHPVPLSKSEALSWIS